MEFLLYIILLQTEQPLLQIPSGLSLLELGVFAVLNIFGMYIGLKKLQAQAFQQGEEQRAAQKANHEQAMQAQAQQIWAGMERYVALAESRAEASEKRAKSAEDRALIIESEARDRSELNAKDIEELGKKLKAMADELEEIKPFKKMYEDTAKERDDLHTMLIEERAQWKKEADKMRLEISTLKRKVDELETRRR